MKEMKRIASLMLAVALLFTCTLPAFADNGVSNGVTIANFVSAAEDSQNAALEDLITSVTIVNEKIRRLTRTARCMWVKAMNSIFGLKKKESMRHLNWKMGCFVINCRRM